jgi:hypothetical protein
VAEDVVRQLTEEVRKTKEVNAKLPEETSLAEDT